jgi:hypothetical protein
MSANAAAKLRYMFAEELNLKTTDKKVINCCLITVNEMLDFRNGLYINEGSIAHEYLLNIKKELEKL